MSYMTRLWAKPYQIFPFFFIFYFNHHSTNILPCRVHYSREDENLMYGEYPFLLSQVIFEPAFVSIETECNQWPQ